MAATTNSLCTRVTDSFTSQVNPGLNLTCVDWQFAADLGLAKGRSRSRSSMINGRETRLVIFCRLPIAFREWRSPSWSRKVLEAYSHPNRAVTIRRQPLFGRTSISIQEHSRG